MVSCEFFNSTHHVMYLVTWISLCIPCYTLPNGISFQAHTHMPLTGNGSANNKEYKYKIVVLDSRRWPWYWLLDDELILISHTKQRTALIKYLHFPCANTMFTSTGSCSLIKQNHQKHKRFPLTVIKHEVARIMSTYIFSAEEATDKP